MVWQQDLESKARALENDNVQLLLLLNTLKSEQLFWKERIIQHSWDSRGRCEIRASMGMGDEAGSVESEDSVDSGERRGMDHDVVAAMDDDFETWAGKNEIDMFLKDIEDV